MSQIPWGYPGFADFVEAMQATMEHPMSEAEWLTSTDVCAMQRQPWVSDRHRELLVCAVLRQARLPVLDALAVHAFESVPGEPANVIGPGHRNASRAIYHMGRRDWGNALRAAVQAAVGSKAPAAWHKEEWSRCPARLRDIVGNPFQPVAGRQEDVADADAVTEVIDLASFLSWGEGTVPRIAQDLWDRQAWGEMPVLGDALEEAGCRDAAILDHARGNAPHSRGCWLLRLLLGRE